VVLDAVFVNAGFVAAFFLRFGGELPEFNFGPYLALAPFLTIVYLVSFWIYGLYEPERTEGGWAIARSSLFGVGLSTIITAAVSFFTGFFAFSRLVILLAAALQFLFVFGWRMAALKLTPISWPVQRVLIVGTSDLACDLARELEKRSKWGYQLVGLLESVGEDEPGETACAIGVVGRIDDLSVVVAEQHVSRLIVASPVALRELVEDLALADESEVRIDVIPELYEIFIGQVDSVVADIPLMELTHGPVPSWYTAGKRLFDVLFALFLWLITLPFVLLAMLAIVLSMGWPVLYRQERVGKDMKVFTVTKLRTMVRRAERETGPILATEDDERITPVGRFLRRYRIDELPQLWAIVAGHMSFVGPRPERPHFVEQHLEEIPGYAERFKVKPGVTGLAQVSGTYATTPERKLKYDLIYMYHQSLLMDLQILLETVRVVLTGRGAV
jgi:exopolysaccharide biosynthesis polyprenyl glycosylphosphotransferase